MLDWPKRPELARAARRSVPLFLPSSRVRNLTVLLALGLSPLVAAQRKPPASAYFRHGQMSMAAKNYDQAYADFRQALAMKPDDIEYELATQRAQFSAANNHIQRAEQFKLAKQYPEALAELSRAQAIDPANFIANQEIEAINALLHPPPAPPGTPVGAEAESSLQERLARAAGPVELGAVANTVIADFTVNGDARNAYLSVGRLAGLNVVFDNSSQGAYTGNTRVALSLHNVSLLQILRVLNLQTDSFYVPITSNTILVANDTQTKHQELDPTVLKVFYIKNVQAPTDLVELAQAIRSLSQPQFHIMPVASINALVMRDTPDRVALVQKVINDLDKAPPEVVVDVRILQVNRDRARDLGLLPPTSFGIGLQAPTTPTNNSNNNGTNGTNGTGTGSTGTTNSPTLNELTHLNSSNFSVTIPNATLSALMSDSNTHTIQEPQLRAIQGQKATLQIGQRIPVATGSFQPGIGGVGINPLVNTQFAYQNIGVNIDMTPQIHGDDEVLLKDRIEISDVDSFSTIGGIQEPVFGNRVIDHTVELRNGQSTVLGGMMVNTITHNISGLPGLNEIPLFKYLFSSTHDETVHNEILIVLTPHIVRSLDITAADRRALDTGTESNISLRELPPAELAGPSAGAAAAAPNPPAPAAAGGEPALAFNPAAVQATAGSPFTVTLDLNRARDAYALTFQLNYDPKVLQIAGVNLGQLLSQDGQAPALVHREDAEAGAAQISLSRPPNVAGVAGSGSVLTITFMAKAAGTSPLTITRLSARNPQGSLTPVQPASATVVVH